MGSRFKEEEIKRTRSFIDSCRRQGGGKEEAEGPALHIEVKQEEREVHVLGAASFTVAGAPASTGWKQFAGDGPTGREEQWARVSKSLVNRALGRKNGLN